MQFIFDVLGKLQSRKQTVRLNNIALSLCEPDQRLSHAARVLHSKRGILGWKQLFSRLAPPGELDGFRFAMCAYETAGKKGSSLIECAPIH